MERGLDNSLFYFWKEEAKISVYTFEKRPIRIRAVHWSGYNFEEIVNFVGRDKLSILGNPEDPDLVIHTLEGDHHAAVGDWIIKGIKGEFYPCKPDIFNQTYRLVPTVHKVILEEKN